jgi:hypothetical protein
MDTKKAVSSLLNQILAQVAEIKTEELISPEAEVNPLNDNYVGVACDETMRLYMVRERISTKIKSLSRELQKMVPSSSNRGIIERKMKEIQEAFKKREILSELFWFSIRSEFDLWDKEEVGIRNGFKVVWRNEDRLQKVIDLLRDQEEG